MTPKSKSNQSTEVSLFETLRREDPGPLGREEKTLSPKLSGLFSQVFDYPTRLVGPQETKENLEQFIV